MYMDNASETEIMESVGDFANGVGDWFSIAIPAAQTYVWWVAGAFLSIAVLVSVNTRRSRMESGSGTSRWRKNPTVSGMRHARR